MQAPSFNEKNAPKPKDMLNEWDVKRGLVTQHGSRSNTVPPSAAIPFIGIDEGQATPKLIRPTIGAVPRQSGVLKTSGLPFGLVVQPMADIEEGE
jgi:hypothetical protein